MVCHGIDSPFIDGFTFKKKIMYDVNQECIKIIKLTVDEPLEFDGG